MPTDAAAPLGQNPHPPVRPENQVIPLLSRRGVRGRRPSSAPTAGHPSSPPPPADLVTVVQARFQQRHLSLTDPATALVYQITVETVRLLVDGLDGTGQLGEEQSDLVRHHLDALHTIPDSFQEHMQG